jgi:hypothetical protein
MAEEYLKLGGTFDLEKLFGETELNRTERRLCKALADCAFSDTEASVETKTLALLCGVTPRQTRSHEVFGKEGADSAGGTIHRFRGQNADLQ